MKRVLSIILCICMMLMFLPIALADPTEGEEFDEVGDTGVPLDGSDIYDDLDEEFEDPVDIEEYYEGSGTIYDLEDEDQTPPVPDAEPPDIIPDPDAEDDEDIYDDEEFDEENAEQLEEAEYVLDEIIICFYPRTDFPGKEKQYDDAVAKVLGDGLTHVFGTTYLIKSEDFIKNPNATMNRFKNNKYIEYVEPNYIIEKEAVPNDPNYSTMSLVLTLLNAQKGWDIISGGSGPIIAVVDSGVANHPDLPPLLPGYSAVTGLSPNNDKDGHGTGVAGTIGMIGNNKLGGVGINWSASIMPIKVDDANCSMSVANLAKGIIWAADNGARIINLSLGTTSDSATLKSAIDYAYNKGCAIFAAAGNTGKLGVYYPARYPNVMAVGASSNASTRATASTYGPEIGVLANQSYNTSTASGSYANMAGTSFSSPQVAGLASLILALNPKLTNVQVYELIRQGAKGNGVYQNDEIGYGFINIGKTLELAQATLGAPAVDTTPPVLTLSGSASMQLQQGTAYVEPGYTAIDNVDGNITNKVTVTGTVNHNVPGTYTLTYRVSDAAGNSASATRTVVVVFVDRIAPVLTLLGDNPLQLRQGTAYVEPGYTAIDDPEGNITNRVTVTGTVNINTPGTYTLTYRVSDTAGNTTTATRSVQVVYVDTVPPVLTLLGANPMQIRQGQTYVEPGFTAIDNIDGNITSRVTVTGTVNVNTPGTYTLSYRVSDNAGNTSTAVRAVEVIYVDTVPPVLTLLGNQRMQVLQRVAYVEPGYTAIDNIDGNITSRVTVTGTVNVNVPGSYTLTYRVADTAGNVSTATRVVDVIFVDNTPPVLTLIGSATMQINQGDAFVEPGYTAIDETDGNITSRVTVTGSVAINVPGVYTLTYRVSDTAGNASTATRNVTVIAVVIPEPELPPETKPEPRSAPVITLVGFTNLTLEYGQPYVEMGFSAVDCKGVDISSSIVVTNNVSIWVPSLYTITYTVADPVDPSLTARVERNVTVNPQPPAPPPPQAPTITIIGSNPIVLHRDSTTLYTEQRAKAVDFDGTDISNLVVVSSGAITETLRRTAGTHRVTYSITSPVTGLTTTTTRDVRILAPGERRDPRTKYGLSGQAKAGAKVTHTGIVSSALGFMDLQVSSIDKNMTITVQLIDTATKRVTLTDTFTAAGTKQYRIDAARYELVVAIDKANGNSKYSINLTMPEPPPNIIYEMDEVPLPYNPSVSYIGNNPIILHIGGTPYMEQGARATDYLGNDISIYVSIEGSPDTSTAGVYEIIYRVTCPIANRSATAVREVWILDPNDETTLLLDEVPLAGLIPGSTIAVPPGAIAYEVTRGDTLWQISRRFLGTGTRWGEIFEANRSVIGNNPRLIKPGQTLIIYID